MRRAHGHLETAGRSHPDGGTATTATIITGTIRTTISSSGECSCTVLQVVYSFLADSWARQNLRTWPQFGFLFLSFPPSVQFGTTLFSCSHSANLERAVRLLACQDRFTVLRRPTSEIRHYFPAWLGPFTLTISKPIFYINLCTLHFFPIFKQKKILPIVKCFQKPSTTQMEAKMFSTNINLKKLDVISPLTERKI